MSSLLKVLSINLLISIAITSCCYKKGCPSRGKIDQLYMIGFNPSEIDTFLIARYAKNTNFKTPSDSFYVYQVIQNSWDSNRVYFSPPMEIHSDWKIQLISTKAIYTVTDIIWMREVCNPCFAGNTYYTKIVSYKVNGTMEVGGGDQVVIRK